MKKTKYNDSQIPIDFSFITTKNFENYIPGPNIEIINALVEFSNTIKSSIIMLKGKKGSGKSHLCRAVYHASPKNIILLDSKNINEFYDINNSTDDILIIDNIDSLIQNHNCEEKIFAFINEFILNKKNILITSSLRLNEIDFQIPDLTSRLKWGLSFKINELNDEEKIQVLKKYALERGFLLPAHVCDYIMSHFTRDLYFLCNSLKFFDEKSLSLRKKITIPFIKSIIKYKDN